MTAGCGRVGFDDVSDALVTSDVASDTASADALDSSLLVHFAFDSDGLLVDRAGNYAASCIDQCPTPAAGRVGDRAAQYTGVECLQVDASEALQPPQMTLSAWARFATPDLSRQVFGRPYMGAVQDGNSLEMFATTGPVTWAAAGGNAGVASTMFVADTWQHLAATHDGATLRFYVDGALAGVQTFTLPYAPDDRWLVGCDRNNGIHADRAIGAIDDVRLYDRVLAESEIALLAQ